MPGSPQGLATLAVPPCEAVESEHLRPLEGAVTAINGQFDVILGALPGIAAQGGRRRRAEAAMTLWWIGNVVLLVVVLPVVVYLLRGVLDAATSIVPSVRQIATVAAAGSKDLDAAALLLTTQDQVDQDRRRRRELRRLPRRDPRRREVRMTVLAATAVGVVTILAVVLIVLALVYYLVSVIVQLRRITNGLDEVIAHVGEIVEKSAPVNDVVTGINEQLDAGVDLLEGLLVKKAGLTRRRRPRRGPLRRRGAAGFRNFPESTTIDGAADRRGLHEGHAHARPARPRGADRRGQPGRSRRSATSSGGSLAARLLYPEIRQTRPESLPRSPVIGTDAPEQYEQRDDIGKPRKRLPSRTA